MVTTDYFLEDSLVLGWVWERVKVKEIWMKYLFFCLRSSIMIKIQVDRMVEEGFGAVETLPRCWMAWAVTAIWPLIFLTGFLKKLLLVGSNGVLVSGLSVQTIHNPLFRFECTSLLHRARNSPRAKSSPGLY